MPSGRSPLDESVILASRQSQWTSLCLDRPAPTGETPVSHFNARFPRVRYCRVRSAPLDENVILASRQSPWTSLCLDRPAPTGETPVSHFNARFPRVRYCRVRSAPLDENVILASRQSQWTSPPANQTSSCKQRHAGIPSPRQRSGDRLTESHHKKRGAARATPLFVDCYLDRQDQRLLRIEPNSSASKSSSSSSAADEPFLGDMPRTGRGPGSSFFCSARRSFFSAMFCS